MNQVLASLASPPTDTPENDLNRFDGDAPICSSNTVSQGRPLRRDGGHRGQLIERVIPAHRVPRQDDLSIAELVPTGQAIGVEAGTLRFGVEKAKISWGTYLQDMMRSRGSASSQFQNYSGRGPSVVVQNANGEKRVLEVTKTVKKARDRATAIEKDFRTLNVAEWCERYDVTVSFASG